MSGFLSHTAVVALHLLNAILSTKRGEYRTAVSITLVDGVLDIYHWSLASLEGFVDILGRRVGMVDGRLSQGGTAGGRILHNGSKQDDVKKDNCVTDEKAPKDDSC
jgi:hypothetical protein